MSGFNEYNYDFRMPDTSQNAFNFGPQPMNIPSWDVGSSSLGTSEFATADMSSLTGAAGGYNPLEFGINMPTFQLGLTGLGTLGNLWGTFQSNKLARDSFNFQKGMAEKNYANQIKSYNTALTDRATTRGFVQGDSTEKTQQYINDNKL